MSEYDFRKWVPVTKHVCEYLDILGINCKLWIKLKDSNTLAIGYYEWHQGRYPHQFVKLRGEGSNNYRNHIAEMSYVTHIMEFVQPELPNE